MPSDKQRLGERGEHLAEEWLIGQGFRLKRRNYRCPLGEIDRIMEEGDALVFIEVKTRRRDEFGAPSEAVTAFKRRQIARSAAYYLSEEEDGERPCRFDVAEVFLRDGNPPTIRLLRGAFDADADLFE